MSYQLWRCVLKITEINRFSTCVNTEHSRQFTSNRHTDPNEKWEIKRTGSTLNCSLSNSEHKFWLLTPWMKTFTFTVYTLLSCLSNIWSELCFILCHAWTFEWIAIVFRNGEANNPIGLEHTVVGHHNGSISDSDFVVLFITYIQEKIFINIVNFNFFIP